MQSQTDVADASLHYVSMSCFEENDVLGFAVAPHVNVKRLHPKYIQSLSLKA